MLGAVLVCALSHAAQAQPAADPVFEAICLCQSGHDPQRFQAQIAVTDANRAELLRRIEAGETALRRHVVLRGGACPARPWNSTPGCGRSSMQVTRADGQSETRMADDVLIEGERRIRIGNTGGIPRMRDEPPGQVRVNPEAWPRVMVINLGGVLVP
jgi:hypothetical protein